MPATTCTKAKWWTMKIDLTTAGLNQLAVETERAAEAFRAFWAEFRKPRKARKTGLGRWPKGPVDSGALQ